MRSIRSNSLLPVAMAWVVSLVAAQASARGSILLAPVPTAPGLTKKSAHAVKLYLDSSVARATLESVDGRAVVTPPEAKDRKLYLLESGERTLVFRDEASGQPFRVTFEARRKTQYGVLRYLGNAVTEEGGGRTLYFARDSGVGVYDFDAWPYALVAHPQPANGFERVSEKEEPLGAVLHLADRPLAVAESALLEMEPSTHILSIVGEDEADPKVRYDYQGQYLRGDERLPRVVSPLLGEQPQIEWARFAPERAVRLRPGEYSLLCFFQAGERVSAPAIVKFKATAGGRFVFRSGADFKVLGKSSWQPTIEPR